MYGRETKTDFVPSKGFMVLSLNTSVSISRTATAVQTQQTRQPNGSFAHFLAMFDSILSVHLRWEQANAT